MALSDRVAGHPIWTMVSQAEANLENLPEEVVRHNPDLVARVKAAINFVRNGLRGPDIGLISDASLANFNSWIQQIATDLQNAINNPGNAGFILNLQGPLDSIAQNLHTMPPSGADDRLTSLLSEAQARLDRIAKYEVTAQSRARTVTDQFRSDLDEIKLAGTVAIRDLEQRTELAEKLLAELGAKGTSSQYRETASEEKALADRWRQITLALGVVFVSLSAFYAVSHDFAEASWSSTIAKFSFLIPAALLVVYTGRQAAEHRQQERHVRSLGLRLGSLGSFLVDLPVESKSKIKQDVSTLIFSQSASDAPGETSGYPSQADLIKSLMQLVERLSAGK